MFDDMVVDGDDSCVFGKHVISFWKATLHNSRTLSASDATIVLWWRVTPVTIIERADMADNDVLVITGGAGGMGLACAAALAARGHLLLVDIDQGQLAEARSMLCAQGARVETLQCDV